MRDAGSLDTYVPVDISEEITHQTASCLVDEYPGLAVRGLVCDFEQDLERIPAADGGRLIAFLGGTVGNLYPRPRQAFLERIAALLGPGDQLLLGTDLVKEADRLEAAYDDAAGVTAEFNKNVLEVLNRELGADFDLDAFEHVARYDAEAERMDIRLRSLADQEVRIGGLDLEIAFAAGEEMRTEISTKFTRERLESVYAGAGLEMCGWFTDAAGDYALSLAGSQTSAPSAAGTCCVMQWMLPPPSRISRAGTPTTSRSGKQPRRISAASSSWRSSSSGITTRELPR